MDKYKESNRISKKNYNSDKTFVQISKDLHSKLKEYCKENNLKVNTHKKILHKKGVHAWSLA